MTIEQKTRYIWAIIAHMRYLAETQKKEFCAGDLFFSLAFRTDEELKQIAKELRL